MVVCVRGFVIAITTSPNGLSHTPETITVVSLLFPFNKEASTMADATMVEVKDYFGYSKLSEFRSDWNNLSDKDKTELKSGIGNGTETY
jgi:hypothetical protein